MRLFIVRHGLTSWNEQKRFQGQVNIPLNDDGIKQTLILKDVIKDLPWDAIYTSPLRRCTEMAELIFGNQYPIIKEPLILEMAFGIYEGESYADKDSFPPEHPFYNYFHDRAHYHPPEGAESFPEIIARTQAFLNKMKKLHPQQTVLAFSHGAYIRTLLSVVHGIEHHADKPVSTPNNCSISVIVDQGDGFVIEQEAVDILNGQKLKF